MRRKPAIGEKHMEFARRLFAGAFLLGVAAGQVAAQENLGRLFFSEQQRQDLDRRRQANVQETAAVVENTVTINGVPQANARRPHDPARVTLPRGEGAPSVSVKIGQTLDKVRGEIRDPVAGGKITTPSGERERKP